MSTPWHALVFKYSNTNSIAYSFPCFVPLSSLSFAILTLLHASSLPLCFHPSILLFCLFKSLHAASLSSCPPLLAKRFSITLVSNLAGRSIPVLRLETDFLVSYARWDRLPLGPDETDWCVYFLSMSETETVRNSKEILATIIGFLYSPKLPRLSCRPRLQSPVWVITLHDAEAGFSGAWETGNFGPIVTD